MKHATEEEIMNYKFETDNDERQTIEHSDRLKHYDFFMSDNYNTVEKQRFESGKLHSYPDFKVKQNHEDNNRQRSNSHIVNDNNFNIDKFKVARPSNDDSDLDVELEADSKQILDFQNSLNFKNLPKGVFQSLPNFNKNEVVFEARKLSSNNQMIKVNEFNKSDEIKQVKMQNYELKLEIDEYNSKLDDKDKEIFDYQTKNDLLEKDLEFYKTKIVDLKSKYSGEIGDKDRYISNMKIDINKQNDMIFQLRDENSIYKSQLDNMRNELSNYKNEASNNNDKIKDLQHMIYKLEKENMELKSKPQTDINSIKQNYDNLKLNYIDLKNQHELLNIKFQNLSDENFNIKRNTIYLEKEMKMKEETIDKLKSNILDYDRDSNDSRKNYPKYVKSARKSLEPHRLDTSNDIKRMSTTTIEDSIYLQTSSRKSDNQINILPSQKSIVEKENKILEIETYLYTFQQEREKIRSDFNKMPEFPKNKAIILKKKDLELSINELTQNITKLKVELKSLNALNRDY
jgi:predicted  nucleic acid-binding Zn-ribbon protein